MQPSEEHDETSNDAKPNADNSNPAIVKQQPAIIEQARSQEHQGYRDTSQEQTTRLRWLTSRVNGLLVVQVLLFLGTAAQACFLYQSNQLTRDGLVQTSEQHRDVLANADNLTKSSLNNKLYKMATARYSGASARLFRDGDEGARPGLGAALVARAGHAE